MAKQYRSPVMASIHETAEGLHAAGVMDKRTMRTIDDACLTPVRPLTLREIRVLREREGASQAVFARCLNVTTGLVSQWERVPPAPAHPTPWAGGHPHRCQDLCIASVIIADKKCMYIRIDY